MTDERARVELSPAWAWTCPECGRSNVDHAQELTLEPDEELELLEVLDELGLDPGDVLQTGTPETVTCLGCFRMFDPADEPEA